jgi:trimeric autotransporter adhesin
VSGTWTQSGSANTHYSGSWNHTPAIGSAAEANSGSQSTNQDGGQHSWYSGSGSYAVAAVVGAAALSGSGGVTESGADDWGYGYVTQSAMASDGFWLSATGSGSSTETEADHWHYSAAGGYSRPLDGGGTVQGDWNAAGGSSGSYNVQSPSTLNPDGSWTTTGVASSSGSGSGSWGYSGSGSFSSSSSSGDSSNGSDSSFSSVETESYGQGWSSQYNVVSTLAANGAVTTITTAGASGGASGTHSYTSSGASDYWSQTGNYAAGSGSLSQSHGSWGQTVTESLQSSWQEGYTFTTLPGQATTPRPFACPSSPSPSPRSGSTFSGRATWTSRPASPI